MILERRQPSEPSEAESDSPHQDEAPEEGEAPDAPSVEEPEPDQPM